MRSNKSDGYIIRGCTKWGRVNDSRCINRPAIPVRSIVLTPLSMVNTLDMLEERDGITLDGPEEHGE